MQTGEEGDKTAVQTTIEQGKNKTKSQPQVIVSFHIHSNSISHISESAGSRVIYDGCFPCK